MKALVLEGGALRGVYTAGVLDILIEEGISFDAVYGVSAGSINALNFLSRQSGRFAQIALEYSNDPRYMSEENLERTGDYFGFDFLLGELSKELVPFDYDTFEKSPSLFYAVVTDMETGEAVFLEKSEVDIFRAVVASSSLPLLALPKVIGGRAYMDGGFTCPLPFERAFEDGADKVVVITTRERGYRKGPKDPAAAEKEAEHYPDAPRFVEALRRTPALYNAQLDRLETLTDAGKVFTIYPQKKVTLSGMENDPQRLQALYAEGRRDMRALLPDLRDYLTT